MEISIHAPYAAEHFETARQHSILHPEQIVAAYPLADYGRVAPLIRPKTA
jgi:hypothetical protein